MQIESVILLLKLSAAPQMAFVQARDMLGDRVKATVSFRHDESLGSAGKALRAPRTGKTSPSRHFSNLSLNSGPKQNRWITAKGRFYFSAHPQIHTPKSRVRLRPPTSTQVSGECHLMSHQTKELAEEMEGNMLCLHFQWQKTVPTKLQPAVTASPLISVSSHAADSPTRIYGPLLYQSNIPLQ